LLGVYDYRDLVGVRFSCAASVMGDLSSRRGMLKGMEDMVGGGKAGSKGRNFRCRNVLVTHSPCARCPQAVNLHDGIQTLPEARAMCLKPS
jgi:hypothetical protein